MKNIRCFVLCWSVLAVALTAPSIPASASVTCFGSDVEKGAGVPYGAQDDGHSAAHAAALFSGNHVIGWIYQDVNGSLWLGTPKPGRTSADESRMLWSVLARHFDPLKPQPPSGGQMPIERFELGGLLGRSVTIVGCY